MIFGEGPKITNESVVSSEVGTDKIVPDATELSIEETNPAQMEIAERMGMTMEAWIEEGYSIRFRTLIHGHPKAYSLDKDTEEARNLRIIFRTDRNAFYEIVIAELKKQSPNT